MAHGPAPIEQVGLSSNYRTPSEIMDAAAPVIRTVRPDANVPEPVRSSGVPAPRLRDHCSRRAASELPASDRVRALSPADAKGLEFDLVVLVDPGSLGRGVTGAVDRYVAMTRATQRLVVMLAPSSQIDLQCIAQILQFLSERRQMYVNDRPDNLHVDFCVSMRDHIA